MAAGGNAAKPSQGWVAYAEQLMRMGYTRVRGILGLACACSCIYAVSLILMSGNQCWNLSNPCANNSCGFGNASLFYNSSDTSVQHEEPSKVVVPTNLLPELHHPKKEVQPALMAIDTTTTSLPTTPLMPLDISTDTSFTNRKTANLSRIVFGIAAAADIWSWRQYYVKMWWKPEKMRGFVWFDKAMDFVDTGVPPFKISENTTQFKYTCKKGKRSAIRISRIVSETFRMGLPDVDWFVMGDDDTVFFPDNLVRMLSKYDPSQMYYIGSPSESHIQNILFSYNMAFGGGGFAISYPLAKALASTQDDCLHRYPQLFGSDDRMQACMSELGVPLTKEPGFHQMDLNGDASGLLAAHPVTPVISIHHLDIVNPIFPNVSRLDAVYHLNKAIKLDPASLFQQSICYGRRRQWSVSVSWGYIVEVHKGFVTPRDLEVPARTFTSWHRDSNKNEFPFNTREDSKEPCKQPTRFFMQSGKSPKDPEGWTETIYKKEESARKKKLICDEQMEMVTRLDEIHVWKKPTKDSLYQAPRRSCCTIQKWKNERVDIQIRDCIEGETLMAGSL